MAIKAVGNVPNELQTSSISPAGFGLERYAHFSITFESAEKQKKTR